MNLTEIYEKQYTLAKIKLDEKTGESWSDTLDKWQDRADYASLAGAGVGLGASVTGVGLPVGAAATLASTVVDLANAGVYGGRAIYDLATGDTEKAKEHALSAGLRALFAVPYLGDVAQAGKAVKAATTAAGTAEKAAATAAKAAPEVAATASKVETAAARQGARNAMRGERRVQLPGQRAGAGTRNAPVREPATVPAGRTPVRVPGGGAKVTPKARIPGGAAGAAAGTGAKAATALSKGRRIAGGAAAAGAAGIVAKTLLDKATDSDDTVPGLRPGDPNDRIIDTRMPVGLSLGRLGMYDTGDPTPFSRSSSSNPHIQAELRNKFNPMWALTPQQRETLRTYGESYDPENALKGKVKVAVNKYLNSPQGYQLNKHLESIRKNLISN